MKKTLITLSFVVIIACNNNKKENILEPIHNPSLTANYKRDSLYIALTVWQFMDKEVDIFDYFKQYKIPLNKVQVNVDSIIYSSDTLKFIAFVIKKIPNYENNKPDEYFFDGDDLIGYRLTTNEPWIIYYFGQYRPTGFRDYNEVRNIFRDYYFVKFKDESEYVWDSLKQDNVIEKFRYNLNEPEFWTKSLVWRRGARIPGLYNFQTQGNVKPGDNNAVKIIPKLDYPDSLLLMYKNK